MLRLPHCLLVATFILTANIQSQIVAAAEPLRVATFQSDVTLPLGHWLYRQPLKTIETPLLAKGIVVEQGDERFVLCAVDWCTMRNSTHRLFRSKLAGAVGTDVGNVAVQNVHQHTAPSVDGDAQRLLNETENPPQRVDLDFLEDVTDRLAAAAKESLEQLQPFDRVGTAEVRVDRVASIRRVPTEDGGVRTRWSSCRDPELRAMTEGPIDPLLKTITLARGDTPLVRLHYYATHPQSFYGDGRASGDVPGFARERLQKKEDVFQIYFTGCSGDVTMGKYNDGTPQARTELTERLYAAMESAAAATRFEPIERVDWRKVPVKLPLRKDADYMEEKNLKTAADPQAAVDARLRAASRAVCARWLRENPIQLTALSVGRVRIVHLPGEPMIEFQHFLQRTLPDRFVAVAGYGMGSPGYVCTAKAYEEGGYEPSASMCPPEAEQLLKTALRQLLVKE